MLSDDDELRRRIRHEVAEPIRLAASRSVLTELRPAMRHARARRLAGTGVSAVLLLGGTAAIAQSIRSDRADTISMTSQPPTVDGSIVDQEREPRSDPTLDTRTSETAVGLTVVTASAGDDDERGFGDPGAEGSATSAPGSAPDDEREDDPVPTRTTIVRTSTVPQTTSTNSPSTSTTRPTTSPTTAGPTSIAPTLPPSGRYDSSCGYAVIDSSSGRIQLVEIVPAAGYSYELEDPERYTITIQFTGGGEDCELTIGSDDDPADD